MDIEEPLSRRALKEEARELLETAEVSPKAMTALYMGLAAVLSLLLYVSGAPNLLAVVMNGTGVSPFLLFLPVLTSLLSLVLDAGYVLYCMTVRRGERAEYMVLFDGFALVGKIIVLELVKSVLIALWSLLFVIPGIVATFRYRFALYNLLEHPELNVMDCVSMSKYQTFGFKGQLFLLDLSYLLWQILAALPSEFYERVINFRLEPLLTASSSYAEFWNAYHTISRTVLGIPEGGWQVIGLAWALVVALFYLPNYQCVNLAYFDAAKRASGVGDVELWDRDGPDLSD